MKKIVLLVILLLLFTTTASAASSLETIWESENLLTKGAEDTKVKEIVKINNNYYIFKEYKKNSNNYFSIQQINSSKKIISELEFLSTSYEYKITENGIIIANFLYTDTEKTMQLYNYNYNLEIERKEIIEYTDTRILKDSTILITDNSILFAFSLQVSSNENALIYKYNHDFKLIESINQTVNQTGTNAEHQYLLKTKDSIIFLNRTYHYKVYCENATKINENLEQIPISKCVGCQYATFPGHYCDEEKCNYYYTPNKSENNIFYSYDANTHAFYDIGEYLSTEKDANLIIQTYKYNKLLEQCEGDYCETQNLDDKYTILIEYEGKIKKKVKVYDCESKLLYSESFDSINNVISTANDQKIVIGINQEDKTKIIILNTIGNIQDELILGNIDYLLLDNNILTVHQITENKNNIVEYVEVNEPEIVTNENGTIDYDLINENGEYKLKITITPKEGYALKEVKVTEVSGKITVYKEMNFVLKNGKYKIESVFTKIENPLTYDVIITTFLALITSIIVFLLYKNNRRKRYAN